MPVIKWYFLAFAFGLLNVHVDAMKIAVIGAGAAGLCTAKRVIDERHELVIYEKSGALGGVWVYTDETGKDKYGVDIHTPMYQGLRFEYIHTIYYTI